MHFFSITRVEFEVGSHCETEIHHLGFLLILTTNYFLHHFIVILRCFDLLYDHH